MEDKYNLLDKEKSTEEHYVIRHGVTEINEGAFRNHKNVTSIEIPNTVTYIGRSAFFGCVGLSTIDIPASVTIINNYAFRFSGLTEIKIPYYVNYIGPCAFCDCPNLKNISVDIDNPCFSSVDGVLYNANQTEILYVPTGLEGKFTIPDNVNKIGHGAFWGCKKLTDINMPESIQTICCYAFYRCTSLSKIDIPQSLTTIEHSAFLGCSELTSFDIPKNVVCFGEYSLSKCKNLTTLSISTDNECYTVEDGILYNKDKTTIFYVPMNQQGTFTIPQGVTKTAFGSFAGCEMLTEIELPDSIQIIRELTFEDCVGLEYINIPFSTIKIEAKSFLNCTGLKEIHINNVKPEEIDINSNAFNGCNLNECSLYVPIGTSYAYRHHPIFSQFKEILTE